MRILYCPTCGSKLEQREIGDEGQMPYCINCKKPIFDLVYSCVIVLVINEYDEVALIRQNYVNKDSYICVAGHIQAGENAEETVIREVAEEIGIRPERIEYQKSYYFRRGDLLMLGFYAFVKKGMFSLSGEVDEAQWFTKEEASKVMNTSGIARELMESYFCKI